MNVIIMTARLTSGSKAIKAKATLFIRATTAPAHIPPNSIFGGPPPSISTETKDLAIARSVKHGRCAEHCVGVERLCINQLKGNMVEVKAGATTSHVRIDIDNGVIVTSAITNEGWRS